MKTLFTYFSKNGSELVNGARMDREWIENGPMKSWRICAVLVMMLCLGVGNVYGAAKTVTYTISSKNTLSTSGTAPTSSGASIVETYSTSKQMTGGNSQTLTLTNYGVVAITNITMSMHSNNSDGAGALSYSTDGGTTWTYIIGSKSGTTVTGSKFNTSDWYGAWSNPTYVNVSKDVSFLTISGKNVVIKIEATANSLYCASYTLTYTDEKYTVSYNGGTGTPDKASETQTTVGQVLTLPGATPPSDCEEKGWVFAGWKKGSTQTVTTEEPVLYAEGTKFTPDANVTMYAVYKLSEERTGCTAGKLSATGDLKIGDLVVLAYDGGDPKIQYKGLNGNTYGDTARYSTDLPREIHILDVVEGNSSGQFAFYDRTDKNYLSYSGSSNALETDDEIAANSSWTVSITSGVATITNASETSRIIRYNTGSPRFACYTNTTGQLPNLYKVCPPIVTYYSNPDCTYDYFVDIMHDNETVEKQGSYSMPAALSDASKGDEHCDDKHYHFLGWVVEDEINNDGTLKSGYTLYPAGDAGHTAANKTFYAIWAKED